MYSAQKDDRCFCCNRTENLTRYKRNKDRKSNLYLTICGKCYRQIEPQLATKPLWQVAVKLKENYTKREIARRKGRLKKRRK